jgi:extradiol dioxygenase family protein
VHDLVQARAFYGELFGCEEGRSSDDWVDFNFMGHQLVCHKDPNHANGPKLHNEVDSDQVPVPHFGIVLDMDSWQTLSQRLNDAGTEFVIAPRIRFKGEIGEQATMFLYDPSGNALEFKAFANPENLFAN